MSKEVSYIDYVTDDSHMRAYSEYQKKYAQTMRESDKVLLELVKQAVQEPLKAGERPNLVDIGCSTGNFLSHVKRALPELKLTGRDMAAPVIEKCRVNPDLQGIEFDVVDVIHMDTHEAYDVVVINAMLCVLGENEFDQALTAISNSLTKGGWFIGFEWYHPFEQQLAIVETTRAHPEGLKFYFRGYSRAQQALERAGFSDIRFQQFHVPIELPKPKDLSDVTTYTVRAEGGRNQSFRGTLFQPWCHLTARK